MLIVFLGVLRDGKSCAKNFFKKEWILHIDPDEILDHGLIKSMKKIKVTTSSNCKDTLLNRQTPKEKAQWKDYFFSINDKKDKKCDYWIVFEGMNSPEEVICKKGGKILFTTEPEAYKKYNEKFLCQFDHIITSHESINHEGVIRDHQSQPWFVGRKFDFKKKKWSANYSKTYDELKGIEEIGKTKLASVICSNKVTTPGHRKRLRFIKRLKKSLGDKIDFFGKGFQPISDKWDAIAPYKYHICLENTATKDYWTEKISDSYLGLSYPIYWGCTNMSEYFPEDTYSYIDINNPDKAIERVEKILTSNTYKEHLDDVKKAKDLVLDTYNFFPHVVDLIESRIKTNEIKKTYYLHPERSNPISIFGRVFRSKVWNVYANLSQLK